LSNTRERADLLSPSRRPPPPVGRGSAAGAGARHRQNRRASSGRNYRWSATVGGDEESFGIFVDQTTKAALRLKIGEDYQGWKLRSVQGPRRDAGA